ncbi:hypothetical protein [Salinivibrio sp. ES.052]|uniref:hypothetical protein n=1 Tax=Salinivibrio sp. ES.052 TaxID=1882823 RepID=UPI00092736C8|nr:hypothetical protein [Salinivibrio sp. ES.052]SIN87451.1 hypothetical protein SAMN05444724_0990 [Salinivibrio sp. ES.052]
MQMTNNSARTQTCVKVVTQLPSRNAFLPEPDRYAPLQSDFIPVMIKAVKQLRRLLGNRLHSVYISGDLVWRRAVVKESVLSLTVVCQQALTLDQSNALNTLLWRLKTSHHKIINDCHIDIVTTSHVRDLSQVFHWGFFFKHRAICLYGQDLSVSFGLFEASWEVAKAMNPDLSGKLARAKQKVTAASTWNTQLNTAQWIADTLIRGAFGLVMHKEGRWSESLEECAEAFIKHYPAQKTTVERLFILLERKPVKKRAVMTLLNDFGDWLIKEYARIDFKIG